MKQEEEQVQVIHRLALYEGEDDAGIVDVVVGREVAKCYGYWVIEGREKQYAVFGLVWEQTVKDVMTIDDGLIWHHMDEAVQVAGPFTQREEARRCMMGYVKRKRAGLASLYRSRSRGYRVEYAALTVVTA